jgi:hypothetical protein
MSEWQLGSADLYAAVMVIDLANSQWRAAVTNDLVSYRPIVEPDGLASILSAWHAAESTTRSSRRS